jgi:hypothetical protein
MGTGKQNATLGQTIKVRRLRIGIAKTADVTVQIINRDEKHVRSVNSANAPL